MSVPLSHVRTVPRTHEAAFTHKYIHGEQTTEQHARTGVSRAHAWIQNQNQNSTNRALTVGFLQRSFRKAQSYPADRTDTRVPTRIFRCWSLGPVIKLRYQSGLSWSSDCQRAWGVTVGPPPTPPSEGPADQTACTRGTRVWRHVRQTVQFFIHKLVISLKEKFPVFLWTADLACSTRVLPSVTSYL